DVVAAVAVAVAEVDLGVGQGRGDDRDRQGQRQGTDQFPSTLAQDAHLEPPWGIAGANPRAAEMPTQESLATYHAILLPCRVGAGAGPWVGPRLRWRPEAPADVSRGPDARPGGPRCDSPSPRRPCCWPWPPRHHPAPSTPRSTSRSRPRAGSR